LHNFIVREKVIKVIKNSNNIFFQVFMKDFQGPTKPSTLKHGITDILNFFVDPFCLPGSGSGSGFTDPIESDTKHW
jgi:hypothetical protein